jgi:hypothetical protein
MFTAVQLKRGLDFRSGAGSAGLWGFLVFDTYFQVDSKKE